MKASELKLYNFVFYKGKVMQIQSNYELFKACIDCDRGINIEPIPLTEEWLLKFGFVREGMLTMRLGEFTCYCEEDYIDNFCLGDIELFDVIPKYVHQLQNLYHALTGQELKIKK